MTRVKMNATHEYEYIANFKVMQNVFKAKRIRKGTFVALFVFFIPPWPTFAKTQPIPVEKLVKCKMLYAFFSPYATLTFSRASPLFIRDDLKFIQWMKRFWDTTFP